VKIGVISDTHGFLDPQVEKLFASVEYIFHAGDIGHDPLIGELESIAPVTAVRGNNDNHTRFHLTETIVLAQKKFLIQHIVNPRAMPEPFQKHLAREQPAAVVFGHSHRPFAETVNGIFYFNPGYSGRPRFGTKRSVAILHCDPNGIRPEFLPL
jgi:putative phosphoesterase